MKALIIYNDFISAARANAALQQSVQNADCAVQWSISPWRVDMLKFPPTSEEALADAADAHLIVFVGDCAEALPFWLQNWLEQWAKCRLVDDVALAVIRDKSADTGLIPTGTKLSHFARRHGLNLIFDDNKLTVTAGSMEDRAAFTESHLIEREPVWTAILPTNLDARARGSYQGWGLND
jgi:hypothetical protein